MSETAKPVWQVSPTLRSRAKTLRRDATDAERLLWSALRAHRLQGASFRRQTPIGPYVADFVCHHAKLVIELDGGQHYESEQMLRDARRDRFLSAKGYRVLRFSNRDVMMNRSGVLETIFTELHQSPSPTLPRKRGREQAAVGDETLT